MVPSSRSSGQHNIKLALLGLNLLDTSAYESHFVTSALSLLYPTATCINGVDWMDFFFFFLFSALQWEQAVQKSWHLQG